MREKGWGMEEILGKQRVEAGLGAQPHPMDNFMVLWEPRVQLQEGKAFSWEL